VSVRVAAIMRRVWVVHRERLGPGRRVRTAGPARLVVRLAIQVGIVEDLRAAARQREIDPARGNGGWIRAVPFPPACTALMNLNADSCHLLEAGAGERCLCTPSSVQTLLTAWLVPGRFSDWASVVLALVFNLLILGRHITKCSPFFCAANRCGFTVCFIVFTEKKSGGEEQKSRAQFRARTTSH